MHAPLPYRYPPRSSAYSSSHSSETESFSNSSGGDIFFPLVVSAN